MRKTFSIFTALLLSATVWSQSPQKMSYQAVVRNNNDQLVTNQPIGMQLSILQGSSDGTVVYTETQTPISNANGLVSIEIGNEAGFDAIDWANGPFFIKNETDPTGGTNYTITGTSELLSVPFALYSLNGTPGPQGEQGMQGEKGDQGIQGEQGLKGDSGIQGETGAKGDKGDQGIQGATGVTGAKGDTGSAGSDGLTTSVNGVTHVSGAITITKANIGLGNVDNTADANKPISSATLTALDTKVAKVNGKDLVSNGTVAGQMQYWNGSAWVTIASGSDGQFLTLVNGIPTWAYSYSAIANVINPTTSKTWMDRNLGATQAATSKTDEASYGGLYQWGRGNDGHQLRSSSNTTTLSSSDIPAHANFILSPTSPSDWRSTQNDNLWQGINGINNPCPTGYRLPTEAEFNAERASWSSANSAGAFNSPLRFPAAGARLGADGSFYNVGYNGSYWSSTIDGTGAKSLFFNPNIENMSKIARSIGFSIRCIKD